MRSFRIVILMVVGMTLCGSTASAVELRLQLEEGKTYYQRMKADQQMEQEVMGGEQTVRHEVGSGLKMEVLDVDAQGNMRLRNTYNWALFKQSGPMSSVDYDSARQPGQVPVGAEGFAALLGQGYTITLSPQGKVLDVNGVEELQQAVQDELPAGVAGTPMMNALQPYISEQGISELAKATFAIYPANEVGPGDSWTQELTVAVGPEMMVESKWMLRELEGGVAVIDGTSTMKSNPKAPPMDAGQMKVKFDLSGSDRSTTRIAEATGLILSTVSEQTLSGQIHVVATPDSPPMMTIPIQIETSATTEMSDRMWETELD